MKSRAGATAALLAALLLAGAAGAQVESVATVGFTTADLDRAVAFFTSVLDFTAGERVEIGADDVARLERVSSTPLRVARLRLGAETIELSAFPGAAGRPIPPDLRSDDAAFQHVAIVVSDMDRAYARLRARDVQLVSSGPQTLPAAIPAAAGIRALYFRDPDGHDLELIWFPPDKGDPRWQAPAAGRLFLGIDHTAIGAARTADSVAFYRDALGLRVAGKSENAGTEQEHLNGVFGCRVQITGLRAAAGPGVELLDFLAPPGGRPIPADLRPNDVLAWQTTVVARDAASLCEAHGAGAVAVGAARGFTRACLVRDPDGHFVRIVER